MKKALSGPDQHKAFLRKCWLLIIAVMAFSSLSAQDDSTRFSRINGYGFFYKRMGIDSVLYVPLYESAHTPYRAGAIKYRKSDSSFYKYTGTQWLKVEEGGAATNGIDTVYTMNDTVQVIETADETYFTIINSPYTEVLNDYTIIVGNDTLVITGISTLIASKIDSLHIYTASGTNPDTLYSYKDGDSVLVGYIPKGVDALVASDGVSRNGASIKLGQGQEEDGNPAMLQENRVIPLGFNELVFRGNSSDSITFTSNSINISADNDGNASIRLVGDNYNTHINDRRILIRDEASGNYFEVGTEGAVIFSCGEPLSGTDFNYQSGLLSLFGDASNFMPPRVELHNLNGVAFSSMAAEDSATISGSKLGDSVFIVYKPLTSTILVKGDYSANRPAKLEVHGRIVTQDSITVNNVPTITSGAPLVLNTDNGTISQINPDNLLGYKEYVATISQISTNDPVATVLKNTTGTTFTWARSGEGTYTVTAASSLLAANKTVILTGAAAGNGYVVNTTRASDTVISVVVTDTSDGSQVDEGLTETTFIIRIYP